MHADAEEVAGLDQLRQHAVAVEGRAGAIVSDRAVVLHETNHAQVFDAVIFVAALRKNDHLRGVGFTWQIQLIIRLGQPTNVLQRRLQLQSLGRRFPRFGDGMFELGQGEGVGEPVEHKSYRPLGHADIVELPPEQGLFVLFVGHNADRPGEASAGVDLNLVIGGDDAGRKTIEETCPSPVARRLIINRTAPAGTFRWL